MVSLEICDICLVNDKKIVPAVYVLEGKACPTCLPYYTRRYSHEAENQNIFLALCKKHKDYSLETVDELVTTENKARSEIKAMLEKERDGTMEDIVSKILK